MSRQYDAKQEVLKAYPTDQDAGVELFYTIMDCGKSDFEYEEGMTAEEYIYGVAAKSNADPERQASP